MKRIDNPTATENNLFTEGSPQTGVLATVLPADWLNMVQEELVNAIEGAGLELNGNDQTQLLKAIQAIAASQNSSTGTIYIGCGAMTPSATDGAEFVSLEDANGMTRRVPAFANDKDRSVCLEYPMPSDWNGAPFTTQFFWNAPDTAVVGDEIRFTLASVAVGDGEAPGAALGAAVALTDAVIAAGADHESATSGPMTVGGAPAAGRMVRFKFSRDFDYGAQPLADIVHGLGLSITYNKA